MLLCNRSVVFISLHAHRLSSGARDAHSPGVQILSISCSFWENSAKSYVGAPLGSWRPLLGDILDPPLLSVMQRHVGLGEFFAHFAKDTLFLAKNSSPLQSLQLLRCQFLYEVVDIIT